MSDEENFYLIRSNPEYPGASAIYLVNKENVNKPTQLPFYAIATGRGFRPVDPDGRVNLAYTLLYFHFQVYLLKNSGESRRMIRKDGEVLRKFAEELFNIDYEIPTSIPVDDISSWITCNWPEFHVIEEPNWLSEDVPSAEEIDIFEDMGIPTLIRKRIANHACRSCRFPTMDVSVRSGLHDTFTASYICPSCRHTEYEVIA